MTNILFEKPQQTQCNRDVCAYHVWVIPQFKPTAVSTCHNVVPLEHRHLWLLSLPALLCLNLQPLSHTSAHLANSTGTYNCSHLAPAYTTTYTPATSCVPAASPCHQACTHLWLQPPMPPALLTLPSEDPTVFAVTFSGLYGFLAHCLWLMVN